MTTVTAPGKNRITRWIRKTGNLLRLFCLGYIKGKMQRMRLKKQGKKQTICIDSLIEPLTLSIDFDALGLSEHQRQQIVLRQVEAYLSEVSQHAIPKKITPSTLIHQTGKSLEMQHRSPYCLE